MLGHVIFLGVFFSVLCVLSATITLSAFRTGRDFRARRVDSICWKEGFKDLPARDRVCRHVYTGEFKNRVCDKAFDCRECEKHAALIAQRPPAERSEDDVMGLWFPRDRFYHRGHTWTRIEDDRSVTVGLDALAERLVADPEAIQLPAPGAHVQANAAAWRMRKRGADVRILSPVDGEVTATGGPDEGWYLKVTPDGGRFDATHLLRGAEIRPWVIREMERLQMALTPTGVAPSMADGGVPVEDVAAAYPNVNWDAVCGDFFLQP